MKFACYFAFFDSCRFHRDYFSVSFVVIFECGMTSNEPAAKMADYLAGAEQALAENNLKEAENQITRASMLQTQVADDSSLVKYKVGLTRRRSLPAGPLCPGSGQAEPVRGGRAPLLRVVAEGQPYRLRPDRGAPERPGVHHPRTPGHAPDASVEGAVQGRTLPAVRRLLHPQEHVLGKTRCAVRRKCRDVSANGPTRTLFSCRPSRRR